MMEATEGLLTAYEAQVLIGTSISGCAMSPDRTFDLRAAWQRLHKLGLIDRTDGIAVATPAGADLIAAMLARRSPDTGMVEAAYAEYEGITAKELAETVARYGKALRSMQEAAGLAIATLPADQQDGTVGEFLASIHRHCASALSLGHGGDFEARALSQTGERG